MSEHMRLLGLMALPALLFAACGPEGQDMGGGDDADAAEAPPTQRPAGEEGFASWDADGDGALNRQEFVSWAEEEDIFGDDWFGDDGVNLDAIEEDLHSALDVDGDGSITQSDWDAAIQDLFGNEDPGQWAEWDLDGDAELDSEEFSQGVEQRNLRQRVDSDGDGTVSEQDVHDFYFGLLDRNDDGRVDTTEWNAGRDAWFDNGM